jgi:exodeoxyribonuclease VII large subunit
MDERKTGDLFARVKPRALGVGELTRALKLTLEPKFRDVWVAGEVSNLRRQATGHLYFSLKDAEAQIGAVVWGSAARKIPFRIDDGMEVTARGYVEIYPPHGKYQLIVTELEPRGAGAQALLLQQLKEKLQGEGLFDLSRKRPLPFIPRRVGVATSPSGAALHDFLRVLHQRFENLPVLVAPCRVQGAGAAATVQAAIGALARAGVDVVVVTRGGGSSEDLGEFNDEALARAIAACPVPVVSAVGHEVDVTIADLVADVRAATPTHAAQLVAPVKEELVLGLRQQKARLWRTIRTGLEHRRERLRALRAELADPRQVLSRARRQVDELLHRAEASLGDRLRREGVRVEGMRERVAAQAPARRLRALRERLAAARERLSLWPQGLLRREGLRMERLRARLEPANVAKLLTRGFALALKDGRLVKRSADAAAGDALRLALGEGWLDARVTSRDEGKDPVPGRGGRRRGGDGV